MERIFDKAVLLIGCAVIVVLLLGDTALIVAMLLSVTVSGVFEISLIPKAIRVTALSVLLASSFFFTEVAMFLPLLIYDCYHTRSWVLRIAPLVLPLAVLSSLSSQVVLLVYAFTFAGIVLSIRTGKVEQERDEFVRFRDEQREEALLLERKHNDLMSKQDYEVSLATLNERGRIAREIHDNVGHLLTRSVLQVEALQVIHKADEAAKSELAQVSATLNEALDSVRASVHDLHDDSLDLRVQLENVASSTVGVHVGIEFDADYIPPQIGFCFSAITREAVSNTIRHSDADTIIVSVSEYPAFFRLSISDNGSQGARGSATAVLGKGMGLQSMEDRARALKGIFRAGPGEGGFGITVSIPKGSEFGEGQ